MAFLFPPQSVHERFIGAREQFTVLSNKLLSDSCDEVHIPLQLQAFHWFNASEESSYAQLVEWLKGEVMETDAPAPEEPVWPEPNASFKPDLADCRPHLDTVRAALAGQSSHRIFLFEGPGNSGKTQFLTELTKADPDPVAWTLSLAHVQDALGAMIQRVASRKDAKESVKLLVRMVETLTASRNAKDALLERDPENAAWKEDLAESDRLTEIIHR